MNDSAAKLIEGKSGYEKTYRIPAVYYRDRLEKFGGTFVGSRVLDFGCGEGLATVGLSWFCDVKSVVGVDIKDDFVRCQRLLSQMDESLSIPENVTFRKLEPAASLGQDEFDVIVSWSVMEHVSQDIFDRQLQSLCNALKPGGFFLFQVAPLYYASFGSHLFGMQKPWGHLVGQVNLLQKKVFDGSIDPKDAADMWDCFLTLNKFTADDFLQRIRASGLEILDLYETTVSDEPDDYLLKIYSRDILMKEQIMLVCRKVH